MSYKPDNNRQRKSFDQIRGIMGISMGVIYVIIAFAVVYMQRAKQINIGDTLSYIIAALMAAYGIFRMYRGYKQMKGQGF